MGIVKLQPDVSPLKETTLPVEITEPNKSIFTALVPESRITSLLRYCEGYPWTVDYYGQILNVNNTLENFDPSTPNLTQPYYKVSKLISQVSSPLTSSYDQGTGLTTITGSSIMPYKITPNVGDVFLAQADSGEDAIFIITTVNRKTYRKDTLYEVSYSLYTYVSDKPSFLTTLENRVNDTYFFNNDTNYFNRDVLIKPSTQEARDRLKVFLTESQDYYFNTFGQKNTGSILIPGVSKNIYDPLLLNFISKIVDYSRLVDTPFYRFTHFSKEINQPSIFDALINCSKSNLININKKYGFISTTQLKGNSRFGGAFHAGMDNILYPINPDYRAEIGETDPTNDGSFINTVKTTKNYTGARPLVIKTTNNNQEFILNLLHELFKDDYYVVSETFYKYQTDHTVYANMSYIELLISRFLNKEAIAKEDLAVAVENYTEWSLLHSLYLLPVMWLVVKVNV